MLSYVESPDGQVPVFGDPWHFSRSSVNVFQVPTVGQDTYDVLNRIGGFSQDEIKKLSENGVIA